MKIVSWLQTVAHSRWYWISLVMIGIAMMAVALGYQYILKELPCVLCIHVRLWISLMIIIAVIGIYLRRSARLNSVMHLSMLMISAGLVDRSYQLLGTERGFFYGDCAYGLGFPGWFPIDQWLPSIYGVQTSCGYTPVLLIGVTMAEALMVMSSLFALVSLVLFLLSLKARN